MEWNQSIENTLKEWSYYCSMKSQMYAMAARYNNKLYYIIGIPLTIFQIVATTTLFTYISSSSESKLPNIIAGSLTLASSILSGVMEYYRFDKKASDYNGIHQEYRSLSRDIDIELSYQTTDRQNARSFITITKRAMEQLESDSSIMLPQHIIDSFLKSATQKATHQELILNIGDTQNRQIQNKHAIQVQNDDQKTPEPIGSVLPVSNLTNGMNTLRAKERRVEELRLERLGLET